MRKLITFAAAGVLFLGLVPKAGAHLPEGEQFFAFQFPDSDMPTIDGNLADWDFIPAAYEIGNDLLFRRGEEGEPRGVPVETMVIRHRIGFNANSDLLYFATEAWDNYHDAHREDPIRFWYDDDWEIRVNPAAVPAEEQNAEGEGINKIIYSFAVPGVEGVYHQIGEAGACCSDFMSDGTAHLSFGWSFDGGPMVNGEVTYYYELSLSPVDMLGDSEENTVWTNIEEGDVYHLNINMVDGDTDGKTKEGNVGFWGISPQMNNAQTDFVMAPLEDIDFGTAVEDVSWGMIKVGLTE